MLGGVISLYAPSRRGLLSIAALRARGSALRRSLGRLCGVRFRLPGEGCCFGSCSPAGMAFSPSGEVWTPVRRAARRGRLWGCAPFSAPLHPPRSTPLSFQFPQNGEGNAAIAAGASLTRCAHSGDLPPRRVNAKVRFPFDQTPFQPTITGIVDK